MENKDIQQWWIRNEKGTDCFGPVTWKTVQQWAREGRLGPDSEVSPDKVGWKSAILEPSLEMDWIAAMPEGRIYGPIHHDAALELIGNGGFPEGTRFFHIQTLLTEQSPCLVQPTSRSFLKGRMKTLRLALSSSRAVQQTLIEKCAANQIALESLKKELAAAKDMAERMSVEKKSKENESADLRKQIESERVKNIAGLERVRADYQKRIGELSGHLEDARRQTQILVEQVERVRKEAAEAENVWRDKLREQVQTVILCETEGKPAPGESKCFSPPRSFDPIVVDAEVVEEKSNGTQHHSNATGSSALADLERQLQWELSQLSKGQKVPDFLKR